MGYPLHKQKENKSVLNQLKCSFFSVNIKVIFYSPQNSRSEYHSEYAEYNCVAIELSVGE